MAEEIPVYESAHKGDYETVRSKVEKDPKLIYKKDENDRLLIHWAALSGSVQLVTFLLDSGSPVDPEDDTNATPLILASSAGRVEVVKLLIKRGADVNHKTSQGHSSLQYACSKGWLEIAQKLLAHKADINISDIRGATPLHRAASKGNVLIVKLLVSYKPALKVNCRDCYLNTALHLACEEDRQEEAIILVKNGADVTMLNGNEKTPLDLCSPSLAKVLRNIVQEK